MRDNISGRPRGIQHLLTYTTAITIALAASGCHVNGPQDSSSTAHSVGVEALKSLPSLEETQAALQAAIDQTTSAVSSIVPGITWSTGTNGSTVECDRPYTDSAARSVFLPNRIGENAAISEQQWAAIQDAAKAAAASMQATEIQVMQDSPGNHDVGFYGPTGLFLKVAYRKALVVAGNTGCRLPHEHS